MKSGIRWYLSLLIFTFLSVFYYRGSAHVSHSTEQLPLCFCSICSAMLDNSISINSRYSVLSKSKGWYAERDIMLNGGH